ncbi:MAG: AAA family ATPase [Campylobacterales bacterium]|nr:AAA family ATPase [Campylobacterales bacterium]
MIKFHFCDRFEKNINGLQKKQKENIVSKILEYETRDGLKNINNIKNLSGSLYLLTIHVPESRVIIEEREVNVGEETIKVFFVRDFIINVKFDRESGRLWYGRIERGEWLRENELPLSDIENFKNAYLKEKNMSHKALTSPPDNLTQWLNEFKLELKNEVFEMPEWVTFASSNTIENGMIDRNISSFRTTIKELIDTKIESEFKPLKEQNGLRIYSYEKNSIGIIFGKISLNNQEYFILFGGANLESQGQYWEKCLNDIETNPLTAIENYQDLSRIAFRSYPKWTLENDELWFRIEKSTENSNLSLTSEQMNFLQNIQFPCYINGQAGSGKSTLLYYIFANTIYYKYLDSIKGEIIFLTENEQLLEDTKRNIFDLLENNSEFGLNYEEIKKYRDKFCSFKDFLLDILGEENLNLFPQDKYLSFPVFKSLYEKSTIDAPIKNKYSAEEAWFVIVTYIYGDDTNSKVTSKNYEERIPVKSRKIDLDRFEVIEKNILPFYEKLLDNGYWNKLKVIRFINEHINLDIKTKYDVIVCDEAQDFCKVELSFILRQSSYLQYDLSQIQKVPIIFAGDSNQTVNPTGFTDAQMTSLLYEVLSNTANYSYSKEDIFYSPKLNYRSASHVVNLANFIQFHRKKNEYIQQKYPQEPKVLNQNEEHRFNIFLDYQAIENNFALKKDVEQSRHGKREDIAKKLKYKIFIVPEDSSGESEPNYNVELLESFEEIEKKTSIEAKGAEYKHVVLYGFGEYFLNSFGSLNGDKKHNFQKSYFFNRLYVAITRAKNELIIIDSPESRENFWKKLVNEATISEQNGWEKLSDIRENIIQYDTDSIKNILESSKEDALRNAKEDKKLGENYQNPSRLKVAASQFSRLGRENEANECSGLAEEILHNYKKAAEYYLEAKKLESASRAYFSGRDFDNLEKIGTHVQSIEHDARIIIAKIMQEGLVTSDEVGRLRKNKNILPLLIKYLNWRGELVKALTRFILELDENGVIIELIEVLETIATQSDEELYETIANIQFKLKDYGRAINAWEKTKYLDNPKYYLAKVELYKEKKDNQNSVIYLNELIRFKNQEEQKNICREIITLHQKGDDEDVESDYYVAVYKAFILLGNLQEIVSFGKVAEEKIFYYDIENLYRIVISDDKYKVTKEVFSYLIERWAKVAVRYQDNLDISLDYVNSVYSNECKKYSLPFKPFTPEEIQKLPKLPKLVQTSPSEHFSHIMIKNFRQFSHITLEDIGQFNLILGDNNVGKTSLLEALLFMNDRGLYYNNLAFAYIARNNTPLVIQEDNEKTYAIPKSYIFDFFKKGIEGEGMAFELEEHRNHWKFAIRRPTIEEIKKESGRESGIDVDDYVCMVRDDVIKVDELSLIIKKLDPEDLMKMQLMPFGKGFDRTLAKSYYDNIEKDKKNRQAFLNSMKIFIPSIDRITADTESGEIDIEETGLDVSAPLHQYGEGANKLFRILVQITLQKEKKLLIDEIDAGIHYSHFLEFWKIILKAAKENDVQIFATTHNLECLQYFKEVLELEDMQELQELSRTITLRKLPNMHIKAYTRLFKEFEYEIDNELEIRGGKL